MSLLLFTVDDGTGVINCLCWKNDVFKEEENSSKCEFDLWISVMLVLLCIRLLIKQKYTKVAKSLCIDFQNKRINVLIFIYIISVNVVSILTMLLISPWELIAGVPKCCKWHTESILSVARIPFFTSYYWFCLQL